MGVIGKLGPASAVVKNKEGLDCKGNVRGKK